MLYHFSNSNVSHLGVICTQVVGPTPPQLVVILRATVACYAPWPPHATCMEFCAVALYPGRFWNYRARERGGYGLSERQIGQSG